VEGLHRVFSGPRAMEGTLRLPLPSVEEWRGRVSGLPAHDHSQVVCVDGEAVGGLAPETRPTTWRRRHAAEIGMVVRDDWQGRGLGQRC
jgi:L-phenylalanine/L-methionine N-acetyltransferase